MNMTYLHHSGFQIETKHSVLLFDYYTQNGMFDRVNEGDFLIRSFIFSFPMVMGITTTLRSCGGQTGHIIFCPMMWNCPRISKGKSHG